VTPLILKHLHRSWALFAIAIVSICLVSGCKKNSTGPVTPSIDPNFVGVWYSSTDTLGFQVSSDGSSTTLVVDTAGKLQLPIAGSTSSSTLTLTVVTAVNGNLTARVKYYIPGFIDTTITLPGTYAFSNNNNTLSITLPNPLTSQPTTIVFVRTSVGAVVRPSSSAAVYFRR
jgi:hypothetical protein